jgi:hypothetical protein
MIASFRTERGDLEKTMNPKKDMDCFHSINKDKSQLPSDFFRHIDLLKIIKL